MKKIILIGVSQNNKAYKLLASSSSTSSTNNVEKIAVYIMFKE